MKMLLKLYYIFFKIGAFTFGGGLAMLPILQREIVDKRKFVSEQELMDYYSIGQCTPGIIAVNTATFIGYKQKGLIGAVFCTLGIVSPSIIIIILIANLINSYMDLEFIQHIFNGIKIVVASLVTKSVISLFKNNVIDNFNKIIFLIFFGCSIFLNLSSIHTVFICIVISVIISLLNKGVTK